MSSSSLPFVLGERHPHAIGMLKEVFQMSARDFDVLSLCAEAPLSPFQCNPARSQAAKRLEERGFLFWNFRKQRWEVTVLGHHALAAISLYIYRYEPPSKFTAEVLPFPQEGKNGLTK